MVVGVDAVEVRSCGWPCIDQPLQLQEVVPSAYCRVSYSTFGLDSDAKVQSLVILLFLSTAWMLQGPHLNWDKVEARITWADVINHRGFHSVLFDFLLVAYA